MTSHFVQERPERRGTLRSILRRILRRDRRFYPLFNRQAQLCVEGLATLAQLLADVRDPTGRVREIEAIEKRADGVVAETLDDILDLAEDVAQSLHLYYVTAMTPEARRLADLAVESAESLQRAVSGLESTGDMRAVLALCEEVDRLEAQADHVYRSAMSKLFREEPDTRQLVKLKAIYELLEELTDKCKNAAAEVQALALR
jgi:uncharacterized protein Yka (UPF0111/DUF47 family)